MADASNRMRVRRALVRRVFLSKRERVPATAARAFEAKAKGTKGGDELEEDEELQ